MTNVPGMGFAVVLLGGFSSLALFASVLTALCVSRFKSDYSFIKVLAISYLGVGVISGLIVVASHFSGSISLFSTLLFGAAAYMVSGALAAFPLLLGAAISRYFRNVSWDTGCEYSSIGWLGGAAVPVVGALVNFILLLLDPFTAFVGSVAGGPLLAEIKRK